MECGAKAPEYRTVWYKEYCTILWNTELCGTECCAIVQYLGLAGAVRDNCIAIVKKMDRDCCHNIDEEIVNLR